MLFKFFRMGITLFPSTKGTVNNKNYKSISYTCTIITIELAKMIKKSFSGWEVIPDPFNS